MKENAIDFVTATKQETLQEFIENHGFNLADLTYKQQLKLLKDFRFEREVDLDFLDIENDNSNILERENAIRLEIYNASICILRIKKLHKYEQKQKIKRLIKSIIPINRN